MTLLDLVMHSPHTLCHSLLNDGVVYLQLEALNFGQTYGALYEEEGVRESAHSIWSSSAGNDGTASHLTRSLLCIAPDRC